MAMNAIIEVDTIKIFGYNGINFLNFVVDIDKFRKVIHKSVYICNILCNDYVVLDYKCTTKRRQITIKEEIQMKRMTAFLLAMLMAMSLMACGQTGQSNSGTADGQEVYTLRLNTNMSENDKTNSAFGVALTNFVAECEEKSNGRLKIDVYMNSQLGKSTDELINGSQSGAFEMFNLVAANWGSYTDAFTAINIPYLFTDEEVLQKFLEGEQGDAIKAEVLQDTQCRICYYGYLGFRHLVNDRHPISSPDDLKGLKMRVLSDKYTVAAFESMGASATNVSYNELYTASQQGLIDGSDGPYANILNCNLQDVQKYLTESRNAYTLGVMVINQDAYDKLPDDLKAVLDEACANAEQASRNNAVYEEAALKELEKDMEVTHLTSAQMQAFKDAMSPVWKMAEDDLGADKWSAITAEIERIETELGK